MSPATIALCIFAFVLALLAGSLTNVLIYRIPKSLSIIEPGSFCPHCKTPLSWYEKLPLLSYIFLWGKCSHCKSKISLQYPWIELLLALLAIPFIYQYIFWDDYSKAELIRDFSKYLFTLAYLAIAVSIAFIDFKHHKIPHELTYSGICLALLQVLIADYASFVQTYSFESFFFVLFNSGVKSLLIDIGLAFFIMDVSIHLANRLYYKKQALKVFSSGTVLRSEFLAKHISSWYLFIIGFLIFLFIAKQNQFLDLMLLLMGLSYMINDIFLDFYFLPKSLREEEKSQAESSEKTVMGGGDIAMMAFISAILGLKNAFLVLFAAFYIAVSLLVIRVLISLIKNLFSGKVQTLLVPKHIALGPSLAIALIVAMILRGLIRS